MASRSLQLLLHSKPGSANFLALRSSFATTDLPSCGIATKCLFKRPNTTYRHVQIVAARKYSTKKDRERNRTKQILLKIERFHQQKVKGLMKEIKAFEAKDSNLSREARERNAKRLQHDLDYMLASMYARKVHEWTLFETLSNWLERRNSKKLDKKELETFIASRESVANLWTLNKRTVLPTVLAPLDDVSIPFRLARIATYLGKSLQFAFETFMIKAAIRVNGLME